LSAVMTMRKKIKRSIERMPRAAYIFLRSVLVLAVLLLTASCLLFALGSTRDHYHLAVLFSECPAGILLLGVIGLVIFIDRTQ